MMLLKLSVVYLSFLMLSAAAIENKTDYRTIKELPCERDGGAVLENQGIADQATGYVLTKVAETESTSTYVLSFAIFKPSSRGDFSVIGIDDNGNEVRAKTSQTGNLAGPDVQLVQIVAEFETTETSLSKLVVREKIGK